MIRRARAARSLKNTAADRADYAQQILQHTLDVLVAIGHSPAKLAELFAHLCTTRSEPLERFDMSKATEVVDLPHVLSRWYSDPQYLDIEHEFRPRALPLRGRGLTLSSLIRSVMPETDVGATVRRLHELGAIREAGTRYLPNDRFLSFAGVPALVNMHLLMAVLGQLVTVKHNLTCKNDEDKLLQRLASNPSIPTRLARQVREEIRAEAIDCLWRIDERLRQYEVRPGSEPTTRLGMSVCAVEYPIITAIARKDRKVPEPARAPNRARKASHEGLASISGRHSRRRGPTSVLSR